MKREFWHYTDYTMLYISMQNLLNHKCKTVKTLSSLPLFSFYAYKSIHSIPSFLLLQLHYITINVLKQNKFNGKTK